MVDCTLTSGHIAWRRFAPGRPESSATATRAWDWSRPMIDCAGADRRHDAVCPQLVPRTWASSRCGAAGGALRLCAGGFLQGAKWLNRRVFCVDPERGKDAERPAAAAVDPVRRGRVSRCTRKTIRSCGWRNSRRFWTTTTSIPGRCRTKARGFPTPGHRSARAGRASSALEERFQRVRRDPGQRRLVQNLLDTGK